MTLSSLIDDSPRRLDGILFRCIDETLGGMIGLVLKDSIYLRMLTKFLVTRNELPAHIDQLVATMEEGFGERSTAIISRAIAKRLFAELRLQIPLESDLQLQDYVNVALSQTMKRINISNTMPQTT